MFAFMKEKLNHCASRVTLKQLRALDEVVRSGTITGAAQALSVTPPAISMQIRQLEETTGLPLLDRTNSGLRPTDAGRTVLDTAHRCEAALQSCGAALQALKDGSGGRVSVGVVSTAKYFAPRALAAFAQAHPDVEMSLTVGNRSETIKALHDYELDIAVMGRPPKDFDIEEVAIGDHPHVIVAPPDHPLAREKDIPITSLEDENFLMREEGSGTRNLTHRLFARVRLAPRIGMEITSNETIKQAVMAGLGIALISAHTVAAELGAGRIVVLDVYGLPAMRKWFVVRRPGAKIMPAGQALWEFLVASGVEFLPKSDRQPAA